jgi:hypothetical protein
MSSNFFFFGIPETVHGACGEELNVNRTESLPLNGELMYAVEHYSASKGVAFVSSNFFLRWVILLLFLIALKAA